MTPPTVDRPKLRAFLDDRARPAGTLAYHEAQGFLFAVAHGPEAIEPFEWIPAIFDEQDPGFVDDAQTTEILGELMQLYNEVNGAVSDDSASLPVDCLFRDPVIANLEQGAPISHWSRGFIAGHEWLRESWDAYTPDELDEDLGAMMLTLSFFASADVAEELMREASTGKNAPRSLTEMAETMREVFLLAMLEYAQLGHTIRQVVADAENEPVRAVKMGRNEPCPCGSGRKYKKCCGA
jgi:uncharacterized protein